jgi:hypothetical protein
VVAVPMAVPMAVGVVAEEGATAEATQLKTSVLAAYTTARLCLQYD